MGIRKPGFENLQSEGNSPLISPNFCFGPHEHGFFPYCLLSPLSSPHTLSNCSLCLLVYPIPQRKIVQNPSLPRRTSYISAPTCPPKPTRPHPFHPALPLGDLTQRPPFVVR